MSSCAFPLGVSDVLSIWLRCRARVDLASEHVVEMIVFENYVFLVLVLSYRIVCVSKVIPF